VTVTALPPAHLLTIDEYAALGEDEHGRTELMEGNLVMSPNPTPDHQVALRELLLQLHSQIPPHYELLPDTDVNLELVTADQPGTARRPDVSVVRRSARQRVRADGGFVRAVEVLIALEIISPGSRRIDRMVKRAEYADAGIPYYWIVDILETPVSLVACRLDAGSGYRDQPAVRGIFTTDDPFPVRIDLDQIQ
jgi:Uma2 family endonuclease